MRLRQPQRIGLLRCQAYPLRNARVIVAEPFA